MKDQYDAIIVGSGPAGMFAAKELTGKNLKVIIVDMGKDVEERMIKQAHEPLRHKMVPSNIMCGVGGAGMFSDGTLNLRPDIGGDLDRFTRNSDQSWELVRLVDKTYLSFGGPKKLYESEGREVEELQRKAVSAGARYINISQRHIGSDNSPGVIRAFENYLKARGIEFRLNTVVSDLIVENGECRGVVLEGERIESKSVLMAPGRVGFSWVEEMVQKHGIQSRYAPIDIGVRIEVPAIIMQPVTDISRDPKFHIRTKKYDDFVRTFCTNPQGFVVKEEYNGLVGVNGHSMYSKKSENTNFAFLVRIELTEPVENTTAYGHSIMELTTTIGGGKPLIQRMGDLRRSRRTKTASLQKNPVKNTLKDVTPGDIAMALPHRIVTDIIEGLEVLEKIVPGVMDDSTLIYAPEIKYYAMELKVDDIMQTGVKNLFAAGDGVGLSRGIVGAAATGILAGRGIADLLSKRLSPI